MTTLTLPTTVLRERPAQKGGRVSWTLQDILTVTWRNLRVLTRNPDAVFFSAVQPIMFVLLFVYVFGGAIKIPGVPYVDYLMPGVFVQTVTFGAVSGSFRGQSVKAELIGVPSSSTVRFKGTIGGDHVTGTIGRVVHHGNKAVAHATFDVTK